MRVTNELMIVFRERNKFLILRMSLMAEKQPLIALLLLIYF